MNLNEAIENALDGTSVLFVGAGFSIGATNLNDKPFRASNQLSKILCEKMGEEDDIPLYDASQEFEETHGVHELISFLKSEFTAKEITNYHKNICKVNWKRIYTTNYDNVLELGYLNASKKLESKTLSDELSEINIKENICLHINGYIDNLDENTLSDEFKLTEPSYWAGSFKESKWSSFFSTDLQKARSIFFIGYSLYDLDISRLLFENKSLKEKTFFILGKKPGKRLVSKCEKFGTVIKMDTESFVQQIDSKSLNYIPKRIDSMLFSSFDERTIETSTQSGLINEVRHQDIFELLIYGTVKPEYIFYDIQHQEFNYYIYRDKLDVVFNDIVDGMRFFVVESEFGNGKTLFVEGIIAKALLDDFKVYSLRYIKNVIHEEIEYISKQSGKKMIIVENYSLYYQWIEELINLSDSNTVFVFSTRTYLHDLTHDKLYDLIGNENDFKELSIDILCDKEIEDLISYLDRNGLSGRRLSSFKTITQKKNYIKTSCNSSFKLVLVDILKSKVIEDKIKKLIANVSENKSFFKAVVTIFILQTLNINTDIEMIADLVRDDILYTHKFKSNESIKELINFDDDQVECRSSIIAEYVLRNVHDLDTIIETLIDIFKHADNFAVRGNTYYNIVLILMKYRNLNLVLPKENKKENETALIRYYESIKNLNRNIQNPHFWLQYAIAQLFLENFDESQYLFDRAYGLVEKNNDYDTYMLDNHYARYLIERVIFDGDMNNCMESFKDAHKILLEQMGKEENRFYPFRVLMNYQSFYDRFYERLVDADKKFFITACKNIRYHIRGVNSELRNNNYVIEVYDSLQTIINKHGVKNFSNGKTVQTYDVTN